jgi:uncharacterized membrane protein YqhA
MNKVELRVRRSVEALLWASRWTIVVAVLLSILVAGVVTIMAAVDAGRVAHELWLYVMREPGMTREVIVSGVIEVVDGFLLAAVMVMFPIGLYSIFIGTIGAIPKNRAAALVIETLDELKSALTKTILLIIFVKVFGLVLKQNAIQALDILWLSLAVCVVVTAVAVCHLMDRPYLRKDVAKADH